MSGVFLLRLGWDYLHSSRIFTARPVAATKPEALNPKSETIQIAKGKIQNKYNY